MEMLSEVPKVTCKVGSEARLVLRTASETTHFLIGTPQISQIHTGKALLKIHNDWQWLPGVGNN